MVMLSSNENTPTSNSQFTVERRGSYIHLVTRGKLEIDSLDAPANAAIALAQKEKVDKLLDDIRFIDSTGASITVQSKGFGILWKLRTFKKVAIVFKHDEIGRLFFSTLQAMHISSKFNGFKDEAEAVAWLEQE